MKNQRKMQGYFGFVEAIGPKAIFFVLVAIGLAGCAHGTDTNPSAQGPQGGDMGREGDAGHGDSGGGQR